MIILVLLMLIAWSSDRSYAEPPNDDVLIPTADWMVPTITGLDFAKVRLRVMAPRELRDRLRERAEKQLEAALGPRDMNAEPVGTLILDLDCRPSVIAGCKIFQCVRELRFEEKVVAVRNLKMGEGNRPWTWATTWAYYAPLPDVRETVSIEELETDLDRSIKEFITAYKLGRWWAKKWEKEKESNANQKDEADTQAPADTD